MEDIARAKRPQRLPTALSKQAILRLLTYLEEIAGLANKLIYCAGQSVAKCLRLRIQDVEFDRYQIHVRNGKGTEDRVAVLLPSLVTPLKVHLKARFVFHQADPTEGLGEVYLPFALARKYPNAAKQWGWQYIFCSHKFSANPRSGRTRRHHLDNSTRNKGLKKAKVKAGIFKYASCHTFGHSFATHHLESAYNIRTVQEQLGHKDVRTAMIYTHAFQTGPCTVRSPIESFAAARENIEALSDIN